MFQPKQNYYTPEEYLALEEEAEHRSEYYQGEIFAMSGGQSTIIGLLET
jgi:Uma2 family endonuclease